MEIAGRLGDRRGLLDAVGRIGVICADDGRDSSAERLFDRAIQLSRVLKDRWVLCEAVFDKARLYASSRRTADAEALCREAIAVAAEVGNREVELPAAVLLVELEVELGSTGRDRGAARMEGLLTNCLDDAERAVVQYGLWRIDEHRTQARQAAVRLYRELHERTPNVEFRERYEQLTGERLPDPPLLPPVADSVAGGEIDIDVLVARAETLSAQFE